MNPRWKVVRTDRELEMSRVDAHLRGLGAEVVLLADGTPEDALVREVADAEPSPAASRRSKVGR